jgi:hypothetical protein
MTLPKTPSEDELIEHIKLEVRDRFKQLKIGVNLSSEDELFISTKIDGIMIEIKKLLNTYKCGQCSVDHQNTDHIGFCSMKCYVEDAVGNYSKPELK